MIRTLLSAAVLVIAAATSQAQTLDRIKETNTFNLGFRTDAPPLSYRDAEGRPAGFSLLVCSQIAQAVANYLQLEELNAEFIEVTAEDRFDKVASGEIDLLCGAATITLSRRDIVDFSVPTYVDGSAVMLPVGTESNLTALADKKVGVRGGTTTEEALENTLEATGLTPEVVVFDSHVTGMAAMEAGELEAYFADQSILMFLKANSEKGDDFNVMDRLLTIEKHGLALTRGDADFRLLIDGIVSGLYANGTMAQIFEETLPGAKPGQAMQALYLIAPTLP